MNDHNLVSDSRFFSLIGGLALRLVSVSGLLVSLLVLASGWRPARSELLVTSFAIYYFALTAFVSFGLRQRWAIVTAGIFLNAMFLLIVALCTGGKPNALTIAFGVLAGLWVLFAGGQLRPAARRRLLRSQSQG